MVILFGIDFQLKKWLILNLKLLRRFIIKLQVFKKVITDTSDIPLKKSNDKDREIYNKILESLDFENCRAIRGESKSGNINNIK